MQIGATTIPLGLTFHDFLIWDNCSTQHRATFDYGEIRRKLHRCGTYGPVPV